MGDRVRSVSLLTRPLLLELPKQSEKCNRNPTSYTHYPANQITLLLLHSSNTSWRPKHLCNCLHCDKKKSKKCTFVVWWISLSHVKATYCNSTMLWTCTTQVIATYIFNVWVLFMLQHCSFITLGIGTSHFLANFVMV